MASIYTHERLPILDLLRIIAILGVILIHTTSRTLELTAFDIIRTPFTFFLNQIARFAVPLFFLLSGFVLEYRNIGNINVLPFYKKRIGTILVPYIVWNFIYFFFFYENKLTGIFTTGFVKGLLEGGMSIQMYFIPALILLYGLFPLLHQFRNALSRNIIVIGLTILCMSLLFLDYYSYLSLVPTPLRISLLNAYPFIIGILLASKQKEIREYVLSRRILTTLLFYASGISMVYESFARYYWANESNAITSQWRISVYMYMFTLSALLFTYLYDIANRYSRVITYASKLSFFVFFSHLFFISLFWKIIGSYLFSLTSGQVVETIWFDLLIFLFVVLFSFLIGHIVKKIPFPSWILGIQ